MATSPRPDPVPSRLRTLAGCGCAVALALAAAVDAPRAQAPTPASWTADAGDGTYRNPLLFADYPDPDVVRVGADYYLVASSFHVVPGLPVLHSTDLVNWTLVGHAAPRLPAPRYDVPVNGGGIWAPSLRFHEGYFWVYYGDPDLGIFMTRARDPRGPWEPLTLVKEAKGRIDPCPLWDDDGNVYLVHAWAKSRAGFNSVLTVNRLSPDGRRVVDEGTLVFDGRDRHPTIEGPKFYERDGYYYIFAPAGGVKTGWQTVLRSRHVLGPYEDRIVLEQGGTPINGPHQGAWIDTPGGESWFLHFQDRGPWGRIPHLQPMTWREGWPVIGEDPDGDGRGVPVLRHRKPAVANPGERRSPRTSDEFDGPALGLQWAWNANPSPAWSSLATAPGALRLFSQPIGEQAPLWHYPALLTQRFPTDRFTASAAVDASGSTTGSRSGLAVVGRDYASLGIERTRTGWEVVLAICEGADKDAPERVVSRAPATGPRVILRVAVDAEARSVFSFSIDGRTFTPIGERAFTAREGHWIGARLGLFSARWGGGEPSGHADVDWFRVQ